MELSPFAKLSPCEILLSLGAGGIDGVVKTRETRLGPTVAAL